MSDKEKLKRIKEIITSTRNLDIRLTEAINQIDDVVDGIGRG